MRADRNLIKLVAFSAVFVFASQASRTFASYLVTGRAAMKGLPGVGVVVDLQESLKASGLTTDQLQAEVELRLRRSGVPILDARGPDDPPGAVLLLKFSGIPVSDAYGYTVSQTLWLVQRVRLEHDASIIVAVTWERGSFGFLGNSRISEGLRGATGSLVDQFANDYLAANPK